MNYWINKASTKNYFIKIKCYFYWFKTSLTPYISGHSRTRVNCGGILQSLTDSMSGWNSVKRSDVTRWKQGDITPLPHTSFCETQWRHSVKRRLYNTPLPHTSFCETQWRHSVKTRLYKNPPQYSIVLASSVKAKEVKVIEFHRICSGCAYNPANSYNQDVGPMLF